MTLNFNLSHKPEYNLLGACTREMIDLYGVACKLALVKKIDVTNVVREWASIKTDGEAIFDLHLLPEQPESFDSVDYQFGNFGFMPSDNMACFVSAKVLDAIVPFKEALGNLVVLPSGKVMEITDIDTQTPGQGTNLFAYPDDKTVYHIKLVPYEFKLHDQVTDKHLAGDLSGQGDPDAEVIGELKTSLYKFKEKKVIPTKTEEELERITRENYEILDGYLDRLDKIGKKQDLEVIDPEDPIYDTSEVDVWHKH